MTPISEDKNGEDQDDDDLAQYSLPKTQKVSSHLQMATGTLQGTLQDEEEIKVKHDSSFSISR